MRYQNLIGYRGYVNSWSLFIKNEDGTSQDLSDFDIYFYLKTNLDDLDEDALLEKNKVGGVEDGISLDPADTTNRTVILRLEVGDLAAFVAEEADGHFVCQYRIKIVDSLGDPFPCNSGEFTVIP